MNEILQQKLKNLTEMPGVYIMKDSVGHILYIGKARNLKNRVRQYFNATKNKTIKVLIMVSKIVDFDYIITRNEIEALVLENNLIKQHKPPYNILLKDDKSYPFIRINTKSPFPKIEVVRKLKNDGAKYFGPYMQGISSRDILDLINSAFMMRTCNVNLENIPKGHRPCLNAHIGKCNAPCNGSITRAQYDDTVQEIIKFLNGNDKSVQKILTDKMSKASQNMEFELAMHYRDKLKILDKLIRKQVTALPNDHNMDIFSVASNGVNTVVVMLIVRSGKLLGGDKQVINDASLSPNIALGNYIVSYYNTMPIAGEIATSIVLDDKDVIEEYLTGLSKGKVNIITPIQGVRKQLMDMADNNAIDFLDKCVGEEDRRYNMTMGSILQLQESLSLKNTPYRIECYDISHISGTNKVASMVVFTNGEKDSKMYRKFKIRTVEGNNDFACMKETLTRRFEELGKGNDVSFTQKPDLIVIDGGIGQLQYVKQAKNLFDYDIEIISIAKREEEIYRMDSNEPIILDKNGYPLRLLQRIRDEAHRFAVTFHKQLRGKQQILSELLEIEGVGKARVKLLFDYFGTIAKIKNASVEEISAIKGINEKIALQIYSTFHLEVTENLSDKV